MQSQISPVMTPPTAQKMSGATLTYGNYKSPLVRVLLVAFIGIVAGIAKLFKAFSSFEQIASDAEEMNRLELTGELNATLAKTYFARIASRCREVARNFSTYGERAITLKPYAVAKLHVLADTFQLWANNDDRFAPLGDAGLNLRKIASGQLNAAQVSQEFESIAQAWDQVATCHDIGVSDPIVIGGVECEPIEDFSKVGNNDPRYKV